MMHSVPTPRPGPVNARSPEGAETNPEPLGPPEPLNVLTTRPGAVLGGRIAVVFGRRSAVVALLVGARLVVVFRGGVEAELMCV